MEKDKIDAKKLKDALDAKKLKDKFDTKKPKREIDKIIAEIVKIHRRLAAEGLMNESAYLKKAIRELQKACRSF